MIFSVLIPVFNAEKYIDECIQSVLNQTFDDFEIVIVDDGSTDNSLSICNKYKSSSKIKILSQKNEGQQSARKSAFNFSKGKYCIFLDADDYWDSNLLQTTYDYIIESKVDFVMFRYKKVSENRELISSSPSIFHNKTTFIGKQKEEIFKKFSTTFELNHLVCKVFDREILKNDIFGNGNFSNVRHGEDLLQSISLTYNAKKVGYLDIDFYNYRTNPTSVSNNFSIDILNDITFVRTIVLKYMEKMNFDSTENKKKLYTFYIKVLLKNMYIVSHSNKTTKEKINFINQLKQNDLYLESIKNINKKNFNMKEKIQLFFLTRNVTLLFWVEKLMRLTRRIKNLTPRLLKNNNN